MNLLLIAEIDAGAAVPAFGGAFDRHITAKHHPQVRAASCTAWRLLELALRRAGVNMLPDICFEENGKPVFSNSPLHFSLSHGKGMAAALLSDQPCAVDLELIKENVPEKLIGRCLNDRERSLGLDFFECWTKKECIGKLDGRGLPVRPGKLDSTNPGYADFFSLHICADGAGQLYMLCALCMNREKTEIIKIEPEALY